MNFDEKDLFNNLMDIAREYVDDMDNDDVTREVVSFMDYLAKMIGINIPITILDDGIPCETKVDDEILSQVLYNMLPMYAKGDKDKLMLLTGMINYITKGQKYTIKDLNNRYVEREQENQLHDLKRFLGRTSKYSGLFSQGFTLEEVYERYRNGYGFTDEDGIYHYAIEAAFDTEETEMLPHIQQDLEEEFYAMAYAYAKSGRQDQVPEIIEDKMQEMRTR